MRSADLARLVALAAIWGASFAFLRILAVPVGPVWTAASRVLIAGTALVAWLALTGTRADLWRRWRAYLLIGVLNSALPFVLYGWAALRLPASYMVVLNAAYPLFAAVLAPLWLGESMTVRKALGLVTGLAGVALIAGAGPLALDLPTVLAVFACLGAALCYALAAIWIKRNGSGLAPVAIAAWSQLLAGLVLLPPALASPPPGPFTLRVAIALLALALLCSAVAYLLYYRLIQDVGPTRAATVTFLMPAFGVAWGVLFLGEVVTPPMLVGIGLVLGGVLAVFRRPARVPATAAATAG
jgi:drug/metabolite transporter (DMT)-like permease